MSKITEHGEQKALFEWAAIKAKVALEYGMLFAIPNGGARSRITGALLKAEGVKPGVPDVFLAVAANQYHGLFIEMKVPGRTVRPTQVEWIVKLREQGYATAVCYSWQEAADRIDRYLLRRDRE